jgi:sialate O-acetylesterase
VTLVITTDCGDADDVHPKSKRKIGERLFKKACRYILGEDVIAESPVMKSCEIRRHTMDIGFETFGSALRAGADGNDETLIGFKIAAEDGVFYSADAVIEGHHVLLTARQVSMPRFVQYAFGAFVPANLYNNEGLPAVPFSTR